MAANLQKAGIEIIVNNRTRAKASELIANGAVWAETPADVAKQSSVLITMLGDPEIVNTVALGEDGFLKHMNPGSLWVDCSTVDPGFSREMATAAKQYGVRFMDAPVAGTKGPAEKGELVFLVGGAEADLKEVAHLLDAMGKKTLHLGAEAGRGASMKMLINALLAQAMLSFSEILTVGEAMDFEQSKLLDILLNLPVTAPFLSNVRPLLADSANATTNFPLKWMHKDLRLANKTAAELDVNTGSLQKAEELYNKAKEAGFADSDFSSIYWYLRS